MGSSSRFGRAMILVALLAPGVVDAQTLSGLAGQLLGGPQAGNSQSEASPSGSPSPLGQLPGAAGSLLGQSLPNLSAAGPDNITGVLSYCVQNRLVSGGNATSLLGNLTGRSGMTSSSGFLAGQAGNLQTGNDETFSLSNLTDQLKSRLCSMILERAQSLL